MSNTSNTQETTDTGDNGSEAGDTTDTGTDTTAKSFAPLAVQLDSIPLTELQVDAQSESRVIAAAQLPNGEEVSFGEVTQGEDGVVSFQIMTETEEYTELMAQLEATIA